MERVPEIKSAWKEKKIQFHFVDRRSAAVITVGTAASEQNCKYFWLEVVHSEILFVKMKLKA